MATTQEPPSALTLRIGVQILAGNGVARHTALMTLAKEYNPTKAWSVEALGAHLSAATRPLRDAGVLVHRGERWYAPNVTDLAAWIADGYAEREDAGYAQNPRVPAKGAGEPIDEAA